LNLREKEAVKDMSEPLIAVTLKIRQILMEMSDDLNKINEQYSEHIRGVEHILNVIEKTLSAMPDETAFKKEEAIVEQEEEDAEATDVEAKGGAKKIEEAAKAAKKAAEIKALQEAN
jgi:hypothetical protein